MWIFYACARLVKQGALGTPRDVLPNGTSCGIEEERMRRERGMVDEIC